LALARVRRPERVDIDVSQVRIDGRPQAPAFGQADQGAGAPATIIGPVLGITAQELPGQRRHARVDRIRRRRAALQGGLGGAATGDAGLGHGSIERLMTPRGNRRRPTKPAWITIFAARAPESP